VKRIDILKTKKEVEREISGGNTKSRRREGGKGPVLSQTNLEKSQLKYDQKREGFQKTDPYEGLTKTKQYYR